MAVDKRSFIGMVEAGEPLIQQAVDAMRQYNEARPPGDLPNKSSACAFG